MRRNICVILCLIMLVSLVACSDDGDYEVTLPEISNEDTTSQTEAGNVNVTYILTTDPNKVLPVVNTTRVDLDEVTTEETQTDEDDGDDDDVEFTDSYVTAPDVITSVIPTVTTTVDTVITSPDSSDSSSSDSSSSSTDTTTAGTTQSLSEYADDLISSLASSVVDEIISTTKETTTTATTAETGTTTTTADGTTTTTAPTTESETPAAVATEIIVSSTAYDGSKYIVLTVDLSNWDAPFAQNIDYIRLYDNDTAVGFVSCAVSEGGTTIKIDISSTNLSSDPMLSFEIPAGFLTTTTGAQTSTSYSTGTGYVFLS